jgi:hypothetical protein
MFAFVTGADNGDGVFESREMDETERLTCRFDGQFTLCVIFTSSAPTAAMA